MPGNSVAESFGNFISSFLRQLHSLFHSSLGASSIINFISMGQKSGIGSLEVLHNMLYITSVLCSHMQAEAMLGIVFLWPAMGLLQTCSGF